MRKDMDRILVGRPRTGGKSPKGTGRGNEERDLENMPFKEGMRSRWRYNRKELNENLAPFFRWLKSNIGRPWDKVYSEIREQIDARSAVQYHILQHLDQYVQLHTFLDEEGIPRVHGTWRRDYEVDGLYVCPKSGLLKEHRLKSWRKRHPRKEPKYLTLDGKDYINTEHGWFEIELIGVNRNYVRDTTGLRRYGSVVSLEGYWDALHKKHMPVTELNEIYGKDVRCANKRPLNKKEIKKLGLHK